MLANSSSATNSARMDESGIALISRLVIRSKQNGARTIAQKAVQVGWATGGWAAAPQTDFSPVANAARLSVSAGFKSVNQTDNRTTLPGQSLPMRAIILIFSMCDLALAWFAARELLQESERGSKAGGIFGTAPSGAHVMIRTGVRLPATEAFTADHGGASQRQKCRPGDATSGRENARRRLRRTIELDKAPRKLRLMMKI
jgi:hypothetical protein